jgi:hypothetical protein
MMRKLSGSPAGPDQAALETRDDEETFRLQLQIRTADSGGLP